MLSTCISEEEGSIKESRLSTRGVREVTSAWHKRCWEIREATTITNAPMTLSLLRTDQLNHTKAMDTSKNTEHFCERYKVYHQGSSSPSLPRRLEPTASCVHSTCPYHHCYLFPIPFSVRGKLSAREILNQPEHCPRKPYSQFSQRTLTHQKKERFKWLVTPQFHQINEMYSFHPFSPPWLANILSMRLHICK